MLLGLIIYGTLDTVSGGFLYDRHLVRVLRARGHTVRVFSLPWNTYVHHLSHNVTPRIWKTLVHARVDLWLQDELNHPSLLLLNRGLRRRHSAPIVSIVHHLRQDEAHPPGVRLLYRAVENAYLRSVDGFVFNSRTTRQRVEGILGRRTRGVVAYPAADHLTGPKQSPLITPAEIRARAHEPGPLRVVFLGNLIPRKGLETLIRAVARLPRGSVVLNIVGREDAAPGYVTSLRKQVRQLKVTESVHFRGYMPSEGLRTLLRRMHVLMVPSRYEGFGIVYLEGMAFGLPAIAGNRGATKEIITPGVNGYLVPPGDVTAIARRMAELHRNREHLTRLGTAALVRFREHPTWDESMGKVGTWLETFITDRPRA